MLKQLRHSYMERFGEFNQALSVKNHTLVLLDSAGVVEEDYARAAKGVEYPRWQPLAGGAVEFTRSLPKGPSGTNTDRACFAHTRSCFSAELKIVFSHIPMFRPDSANCGPLRESGSIRRGAGPGYQNTLGKKTTAYLLRDVKPLAVFRYVVDSFTKFGVC